MGNYNNFAQEYADKTAEMEKETRRHFYSLLPDLAGKTLLDVGCGSGHDAVYYSSHGAVVNGIDISDKEIEMVRKLNCGTFIVGSMDTLPYQSNSFDLVTSFYALQASDNVEKSLLEMIRVAKPGATILISTKHPLRNLLENMVNDKKSDYYNMGTVTSYIFNREIKLTEPGHTMSEYLSKEVLENTILEKFEEHTDFPVSDQVIPGSNYPTFMILKFRKR